MMATKQPWPPDELRMKSADFDLIMQMALDVAAPLAEPKPKAKRKKRAVSKKAAKP